MDHKNNDINIIHEDEISLGEFLSSTKLIIKGLLQHWKELLLCIIIGISLAFIYAKRHVPQYEAQLSFILSDDGGQISSVSGIFSQLGLPVSTGRYNIDKLIQISKSRVIVQKALFDKLDLDGKTDFLANHLLDLYELRSKWENKTPDISGFSFVHNAFDDFSDVENFMLKKLFLLVVGSEDNAGSGLLSADYGRDHYVMTFAVKTRSEKMSISLAKSLYKEVSRFYTDISKEKKLNTFLILESKRDSIRTSLSEVEYALAKLEDQSLGEFTSQSAMKESEYRTKSLILRSALIESEKNVGLAEFSLESSTPLIQLIDSPIPPLQASYVSIVRILIFGICGGFLLFLFVEFIRYLVE